MPISGCCPPIPVAEKSRNDVFVEEPAAPKLNWVGRLRRRDNAMTVATIFPFAFVVQAVDYAMSHHSQPLRLVVACAAAALAAAVGGGALTAWRRLRHKQNDDSS